MNVDRRGKKKNKTTKSRRVRPERKESFIEEGSVVDLSIKGIKGLQRFIRKKRMEKSLPEVIDKIRKEIEEFEPARRRFDYEYDYQLNLHGYLKKSFPQAVIEKQTRSSRSDIIIDSIAIEIKGPTKVRDLRTIADKILRYLKYYKYLFIVLFDVDINEEYYEEWSEGIIRDYSDRVMIIRK
jgi:hypothetical protein